MASSVGLCQTWTVTSPPREGELTGTTIRRRKFTWFVHFTHRCCLSKSNVSTPKNDEAANCLPQNYTRACTVTPLEASLVTCQRKIRFWHRNLASVLFRPVYQSAHYLGFSILIPITKSVSFSVQNGGLRALVTPSSPFRLRWSGTISPYTFKDAGVWKGVGVSVLPLKYFLCWSDWRWPFLIPSRTIVDHFLFLFLSPPENRWRSVSGFVLAGSV